MSKKVVPFPENFPISNAVLFNGKSIMEISGQIGINPKTNELERVFENQTKRVLENIKAILENEG
jgi:enamine deaminase RidA (YjgF/YER057c/UK114 family)